MNAFTSFAAGRAFGESLRFAVQWRVWLLWIVTLALPAYLGIAPLQAGLAGVLDHLPDGAALAQGFSVAQNGDLMAALGERGGSYFVALAASLLLTLLLAPWLTGVAIVAARAQRAPRVGELVAGGLAEYPRQLRLLLWAVVVYAVAFAVWAALSHWAQQRAERMLLESSARHGFWLATFVGVVAFAIAHATLEAARAFLVVRPADGGALRAWWRGLKLLLRRPLPGFGLYLGTLLIGLVVAGVIALVRVRVAPIGWPLVALALVLTQLGVVATAWGRVMRLRALSHLAQDEALRRYRPRDKA